VSVWIDGLDRPLSATSSWETGISPVDWSAQWITYVEPDTVTEPPFLTSYPSPYLRTEVTLSTAVGRARAYVTALGLYELRINGARVGGAQVLAPGWTDYNRRIAVQTYDVTPLLRQGPNAIGAILGDGWYAGRIGFFGRWQYGDHPALLLQLEIEGLDGSTRVFASDAGWRGSYGPLLRADLLDGVLEDRRLEQRGWDEPGFDDSAWGAAQRRSGTGAELVSATEGIVEVTAELEPRSSERRGDITIVDFGQNIAGRVFLTASEAGTVVVRHAEMLDANGNLYTENLRSAAQQDEYIVTAGDERPLVPAFTYHGFRYAEISGVADFRPGSVRAQVISSALRQTGSFACSDPLLNRLQENIVWSQRGNFLSVPTDCPQRDERLGWTGDALCFIGTASFNYDTLPFFRKWLADLDDAQLPSGAYPDIAPRISWSGAGNSGWAEAGVLLPWTLFVRYGDERVLTERYDGMKRFMRFLEDDSTDHIRDAGRYGDWLSLGRHTPKELIGSAYLAATADTMTKIAEVVDAPADAERFADTAAEARAAFVRTFVDDDGRVRSGTQTAYVLALHHDLLPADLRDASASFLAEDIERTGHLSTGFLGTPIALPVLTRHGRHELACRLAQRTEYPSWCFSVVHGATTIWERWDGWTAENGFKDARMNSFNHYALGAVGDWLYRDLAGLDPDERAPGYGHVFVRPRPGGTVTSASVRYESVRGTFMCQWEKTSDAFNLDLTVPPNATASVQLPHEDGVHEVGSGSHRFASTTDP
jgi:alpha-L-rhamnosidase